MAAGVFPKGSFFPPLGPGSRPFAAGCGANLLEFKKKDCCSVNKLKLMTVIGTRPEIIRLSAVIKKCDKYFDQILVHTGQNYDYTLNQIFFEDLGLRAPDFYLDAVGKDLG